MPPFYLKPTCCNAVVIAVYIDCCSSAVKLLIVVPFTFKFNVFNTCPNEFQSTPAN